MSFLRFLLPFQMINPVQVSLNDLEEMKLEASRHNQLFLFYSQVKRYRELVLPAGTSDAFLEGMKDAYYRNVVRSLRQEDAQNRTISLLSAEGVPSVLLRGNAIARDIYADPYCRSSVDIDILIREDDLERADSVLSKNGYVRSDDLPLKFWVARIHHAVYRCPGSEDLIELHWNFCIPSFFNLSSGDIWACVVRLAEGQYKLSPEMLLIHLLLHHYMHAFRELRVLIDLIWAFYKYEDIIDWKAFAQELRKTGLIKTTQITLRQMQYLAGEFAHELKPVLILLQEIREMSCKEPALLYSFFKMDIHRKYKFQDKKDKFASRFALDKVPAILFSFAKVLFPAPGIIKALYGNSRPWGLPVNYLRFIVWRVKEWTGRKA